MSERISRSGSIPYFSLLHLTVMNVDYTLSPNDILMVLLHFKHVTYKNLYLGNYKQGCY